MEERDLDPDPLRQFERWFEEARASGLAVPEAMALATATAAGGPSVRMVLLKGADERGFAFHTNYESRKGVELTSNPRAALLFHWQPLGRQVRVEGRVERIAVEESEAYFRTRPLDGAPYPYLVLDALVVKCREGSRTVNACVVHAVAVNQEGFRESLGLDVVTSEDGAAWLAFMRSLVARGLSGVKLCTSDAHPGLVDAIAATLPGASWQRCRTHFMRNLLTRVPKSAQSFVATMVRSTFAQPDADTVLEQHARVVEQLGERFPAAAELLAEAAPDLLAFTHFPKEHWRQLWSNNSLERLNKEIRRRTDVVGIFPDRASIVRLVMGFESGPPKGPSCTTVSVGLTASS